MHENVQVVTNNPKKVCRIFVNAKPIEASLRGSIILRTRSTPLTLGADEYWTRFLWIAGYLHAFVYFIYLLYSSHFSVANCRLSRMSRTVGKETPIYSWPRTLKAPDPSS